jgi:hypothetical protein
MAILIRIRIDLVYVCNGSLFSHARTIYHDVSWQKDIVSCHGNGEPNQHARGTQPLPSRERVSTRPCEKKT